ncbi:MAG: histidine phosphatase family protein [Roseobacter sp.]
MKHLLALLLFLPTLALADDWDAFSQPGAHAIMRHALAPGGGDPANFDVNDCATQRNLSDRGRDQARAIGQALKDRGIAFDRILTSQWCRSRETAELLGMGPVTEEPALNSFFQDRSTAQTQTQTTRDIAAGATGPLMMVAHQVNITALTGVFPASGEIVVFRVTDEGIDVLGQIEIAP